MVNMNSSLALIKAAEYIGDGKVNQAINSLENGFQTEVGSKLFSSKLAPILNAPITDIEQFWVQILKSPDSLSCSWIEAFKFFFTGIGSLSIFNALVKGEFSYSLDGSSSSEHDKDALFTFIEEQVQLGWIGIDDPFFRWIGRPLIETEYLLDDYPEFDGLDVFLIGAKPEEALLKRSTDFIHQQVENSFERLVLEYLFTKYHRLKDKYPSGILSRFPEYLQGLIDGIERFKKELAPSVLGELIASIWSEKIEKENMLDLELDTLRKQMEGQK